MSNEQMPIQNNQQQPIKREYSKAYKGTLLAGAIASYAMYYFFYASKDLICIYDAFQVATINANRPLVQNQALSAYQGNNNNLTLAGKAFIGTGQVLMDVWIAFLGLIWIVKIKNVRAFVALGIFFLIRAIVFLNIQKLPFPESLVWRSPGFFSFTVPYDHTRDFFYSGHTGSLFIILLQVLTLELKIVVLLASLSLIYMINMLLITRVHYVIDIIGALVIAIWLYRLSIRYVVYADKLFSLPFFVGKWLYQNKCSQKAPQNNQNGQNIPKPQQMQNKRKALEQEQINREMGQLQIECVQSAERIRL